MAEDSPADLSSDGTKEQSTAAVTEITSTNESELISDTESVGSVAEYETMQTKEANLQEPTHVSDEDIAKAEEFKDKGNSFFKLSKFESAIEMYTEAVFCKVSNKQKAIYYCNRALANLKMENSAFALFDASESIKLDPKNAKAFYRRG